MFEEEKMSGIFKNRISIFFSSLLRNWKKFINLSLQQNCWNKILQSFSLVSTSRSEGGKSTPVTFLFLCLYDTGISPTSLNRNLDSKYYHHIYCKSIDLALLSDTLTFFHRSFLSSPTFLWHNSWEEKQDFILLFTLI